MRKVVESQDTGAYCHTPSPYSSALPQNDSGHSIIQLNPRVTSGSRFHYRSFTHSLEAYERAAKKEYILLMRNLEYTRQYPNFHIIVNFWKRMPIKEFSKMRNHAFDNLKKWEVRGFYVHEPTVSRNWLHIHIAAIYGGHWDDLRNSIKLAWTFAGLIYDRDFQVKVKPVNTTHRDYQRLCAYILKFNGGRATNQPVLFIKDLGLRKIGTIGRWFAQSKEKLWQEYREELRQKREQQTGQDIADVNVRLVPSK